ncbi:MAG: hypothetical protein ABSA78_20055 [Candidatus Sulfotelmatobacter sp.]|jgi:hypothetical protein
MINTSPQLQPTPLNEVLDFLTQWLKADQERDTPSSDTTKAVNV